LPRGSALSSRPGNFSWIIKGELAGRARPDDEAQLRWLKTVGIRAIVCLNREHPLEEKQVTGLGFEYLFIPVRDFAAPKHEQMVEFVSFAREMIEQQRPVLVCCGAGIGRTGTMLAVYLVSQCASAEEALRKIEENRGIGVESYAQREAVFEYARQIGKCTGDSA
jgi:atypical dual specificity phosphatase